MARRASLKATLAASFGILAFATTALMGALIGEAASYRLETFAGQRADALALAVRERLEDGLAERRRAVVALAEAIGSSPALATRDRLERIQREQGMFAWLGYAGRDGTIQAATDGLLEGLDVSRRPWFMAGFAAPTVSGVHDAARLATLLPHDPATPLRLVTVSAPVRAADGSVVGVVGAQETWAWAQALRARLLPGTATADQVDVLVLDRDGRVLLGPPALVGERLALPAGHVADLPDGRFLFARAALRFGDLGWTVLARQTDAVARRPAVTARWRLFEVAGVIGLIMASLGWVAAGRIARPLQGLAAAAERARGGGAGGSVPAVDDYAEAASLADALRATLADADVRRGELEARIVERTDALALANDQARQQAALLQATLDNLEQGVAAFDAELELVAWNERYVALFGFPPESLAPGVSLLDLVRLDAQIAGLSSAEADAQVDAARAAAGRGGLQRFQRSSRDGRLIDVAIRPTAEGGLVAVYADITHRRQAEALVRRQADRLQLMQEIAAIANSAADLDSVLHDTVQRLCAHFDWQLGQAFRRSEDRWSFLPVGAWVMAEPARFEPFVVANRRPVDADAELFRRADVAWVEDVREDPAFPRREAAAACGVAGYLGLPIVVGRSIEAVVQLFADRVLPPDAGMIEVGRFASVQLSRVAERLAAAEALKAREEKLEAIHDTVPDALLTLDGDGRVDRANEAAEWIFRLPAPILGLRRLADLVPSLDAPTVGRFEGDGVRGDGSRFPAEIAIATHGPAEHLTYVAVLRDITERRAVERLKNEFVSTVSHELRTPLTSIAGALGLLEGGIAGVLTDRIGELVGIAHKNAQRLVRLINDILDLEKIEAGKLDFRFAPVEVATLLQQAADGSRPLAAAAGIAVEIDAAAARATVRGDLDRLMQVMANLLSNAIKFSPAGARVTLSAEPLAHAVRISVIDRGRGIPESFRDRVFQRFAQADASDARDKGGTGLGLSIAQSIVLRHGGCIGFDSAEGQGSRFWFELPLATPPEPGPPVRILVCTDDAGAADRLRGLLAGDGYLVDQAPSAEAARQALDGRGYAALIVDPALPDQAGLALIAELRRLGPVASLPVLALGPRGAGLPAQAGLCGFVTAADGTVDGPGLRRAVSMALRLGGIGSARLLHVEDDPDVARLVAAALGDIAAVTTVDGVQAARAALATGGFDLIILDLALSDGSGFELVTEAHRPPPIVVFSANEGAPGLADRVARVLVKSRSSLDDLKLAVVETLADRRRNVHTIEPAD